MFIIGCIIQLIILYKYSIYNLEIINKYCSYFVFKRRYYKEIVFFCLKKFKYFRVDGEKIVLMKFRRVVVLKIDIKYIKKVLNIGVLGNYIW